jgi:hypothetical protein
VNNCKNIGYAVVYDSFDKYINAVVVFHLKGPKRIVNRQNKIKK